MKTPEASAAALNEALPDSHVSDIPFASAPRALPAGTRLDPFEIEGIVAEGRTTIVYAATDRTHAAPVAIGEYMPVRIALRNHAAQVMPRSPAQADVFAKGLRAFIDETRVLARCDHPSLVHILRLWEANATAYHAMPRYPARHLLEVRRGMNEPPDEEALRALLDALLGALETFHQAGGFHGNVSPSNILLLADNRPLLLCPGAARRAIVSDRIDELIPSTEPSFAPIEQIVESTDVPLSPSVDLYALAGVARYWMSGQLPAPALGAPGTARRERFTETVQRLRLTWPRLHYSASLLNALESALSIYPAERPQSVAEMRGCLDSASADAGGLVSEPWIAVSSLNDAEPSSPVPPADAAQDPEAVVAFAPQFAPQPAPLATDVTRIDDHPSARTAFARQVTNSRRGAMWSGAVMLLLAALLAGVYEVDRERGLGRVLDVLGLSRGNSDRAAVSASIEVPAAPVPAPMAADAGTATSTPTEAAKSKPTESAAADFGSAKSMPTESAAADSGSANSMPTETPAADSGSAKSMPTEAAAADSGSTKSMPTEAAAADLAASAGPPASSTGGNRASRPARVARQNASREPASPRAVCGARTDFALYRCMQLECGQRQWLSHPQCERLRTNDSVD